VWVNLIRLTRGAADIYIYIYIYICVCVCVYTFLPSLLSSCSQYRTYLLEHLLNIKNHHLPLMFPFFFLFVYALPAGQPSHLHSLSLCAQYRTYLLEHLLNIKSRHWEESIRLLAARAAAKIAPLAVRNYRSILVPDIKI